MRLLRLIYPWRCSNTAIRPVTIFRHLSAITIRHIRPLTIARHLSTVLIRHIRSVTIARCTAAVSHASYIRKGNGRSIDECGIIFLLPITCRWIPVRGCSLHGADRTISTYPRLSRTPHRYRISSGPARHKMQSDSRNIRFQNTRR